MGSLLRTLSDESPRIVRRPVLRGSRICCRVVRDTLGATANSAFGDYPADVSLGCTGQSPDQIWGVHDGRSYDFLWSGLRANGLPRFADAFLLYVPRACADASRNDGGVDHGVLVVGIIGQRLEKTPPNPLIAQRENRVCGCSSRAEARRYVAPRNTRPEFPDHGVDVSRLLSFAVAPNVSRTTRQQILDPCELVVRTIRGESSESLRKKAPHESCFYCRVNPLD